MSEAIHSNPLWSFVDARGIERTGHVERVADFGGTDQTMVLRDCASGEVCLVSGSRLKAAQRLWHACDRQEREALNRGEEPEPCDFCGEFIEVSDVAIESTWQQWRCPCCGNWNARE